MSFFGSIAHGISHAVDAVVHNPVAKAAGGVAAVATGGLLAPVALGIQSAALADNVHKHGVLKGLKVTASEELAAKDPREVSRAATKLLPKKVQKVVPVTKLIDTAVDAFPGARKALDANDALRRALASGKPEDIVKATAAGVNLTGGERVEHFAALQSAINKLPKGAKQATAVAGNAIAKLHAAAQGRVKVDAVKKQQRGITGLLIPLEGKGKLKGKWRFGNGTRGFLLTSDGHIRVGNFVRA